MSKKVAVCLADGFEEMEALGVADVLRRAGLAVSLLSFSGCHRVVGSHGIRVEADQLMEEADLASFTMLVLPGGMPGAANLAGHKGLHEWLLEFSRREDKYLAAICAAPMVLGRLGILEGRKATCYPGFENQLPGAVLMHEGIVEDGRIVTAKGAGWAVLFALRLVVLLAGREKAAAVATALQLPAALSEPF